MKITILGMGCPRCKKLAENAETAAKELGLTYELEEITDKERIASEFGGPALPALVLDGNVVSAGQILEPAAAKDLMKNAAESARVFDVTQRQDAVKAKGRRLLAFGVLLVLVVLAVITASQRPAEETAPAETAASVAASVPPVVVSETK